tara:strand:+ start:764 stop:1120 length:357 start_codon:yes stop_codon:yes gene_type:complete
MAGKVAEDLEGLAQTGTLAHTLKEECGRARGGTCEGDVGGQEAGYGLPLEGCGRTKLRTDSQADHVAEVGVISSLPIVEFEQWGQGVGAGVLLQVGSRCPADVGRPRLQAFHRIGSRL